jgi:hypothetical protein
VARVLCTVTGATPGLAVTHPPRGYLRGYSREVVRGSTHDIDDDFRFFEEVRLRGLADAVLPAAGRLRTTATLEMAGRDMFADWAKRLWVVRVVPAH